MPRRNGNGRGAKGYTDTSKHPSVVQMEATLENIGRQLSLDDFLERQLARLRSEQSRNAAIHELICGLDIDDMDPRSEEEEP